MTKSKSALHRTSKIGSDLAKVDAHVVTAEELDEIPELTDDWIATADMHKGGKLVRRGRPKAEKTKVPVKLRIDEDVVQSFKAEGPGWQTRMNDVLKVSIVSGAGQVKHSSGRRLLRRAARIIQESPTVLVAYKDNAPIARAVLDPKKKAWIVSYEHSGTGRVIATSPLKKFALLLLQRVAGGRSIADKKTV